MCHKWKRSKKGMVCTKCGLIASKNVVTKSKDWIYVTKANGSMCLILPSEFERTFACNP